MRMFPIVMAVALAMWGCSVHAARDPAPAPAASASAPVAPASAGVAGLDGTAWHFVEVAGVAVPAGVTATLRLHNGRASGKAGCNAYGASWQVAPDGGTQFGMLISTKMACLAPAGAMQVERGVLDALRRAARVQRDGDSLVLRDASGKPLAKLQAIAGG